jgi:Tol biopolymer transport system component
LPPREVAHDAGWVWSPKGSQLALVRGGTLSVLDAPTGQVHALAATEWTPVWSPDATRLVFGERGGSIFSIDVGTGERSLVVRLPGANLDSVDEIAFSPDGTRLAIFNDLEPGLGRLYVLNADGSSGRVLADDVLVSGIDWSPDGSRIAYTEIDDVAHELTVWVAPADGSAPSKIASQPVSSNPREYKGGSPVWSPDGSQIGFWTTRDKAFVVNGDGSGEVAPLDTLTYQSWRGGWFACNGCPMSGY